MREVEICGQKPVLFTIGIVAGLGAGWILLRLMEGRPASGGIALAMGLAAAIGFLLSAWLGGSSGNAVPPAAIPVFIGLPFAASVFSIGAIARGERRWINWLALALALPPALFWIFFAVGEIVGPPH